MWLFEEEKVLPCDLHPQCCVMESQAMTWNLERFGHLGVVKIEMIESGGMHSVPKDAVIKRPSVGLERDRIRNVA